MNIETSMFFCKKCNSSIRFHFSIQFKYRNIFFSCTLELEAAKKQAEVDKKAIDELVRERDILNKVSTVHMSDSAVHLSLYLIFSFFI